MTDSDGDLAISRNHALTRPAKLFFFGVCAPGRCSWLQSLGRNQVAPRGGADGAGKRARTATSKSLPLVSVGMTPPSRAVRSSICYPLGSSQYRHHRAQVATRKGVYCAGSRAPTPTSTSTRRSRPWDGPRHLSRTAARLYFAVGCSSRHHQAAATAAVAVAPATAVDYAGERDAASMAARPGAR